MDIASVFERLQTHHLHVKLTKCIFAVSELEFCGMNVSTDGFSIQDSQVSAVCNYPPKDPSSSSKKYVQQFMGSVRFFADFVPWLADIALPLFRLTKNANTTEWSIEHQSVIRIIQYYLTTAPVLGYFDSARPQTYVTTDASDFAIGGWLSQTTFSGKTVIVSYWSRQIFKQNVTIRFTNASSYLCTASSKSFVCIFMVCLSLLMSITAPWNTCRLSLILAHVRFDGSNSCKSLSLPGAR